MGKGSSVPAAPEFTEKRVKRHEDLTLSWQADCEVEGQWKKDGLVLKDAGRIRISSTAKTHFSLTIISAREEDAGTYTLELSNSTDKVDGSAKVIVLAKDACSITSGFSSIMNVTAEMSKVEVNVISWLPPPIPTAPSFNDIHVQMGKECKIIWEADYEVKGQWNKDGEKLINGARVTVTEGPTYYTVTISNAQKQDEGKYTLQLFNSEGTASGSAQVKVHVPIPTPEAPQFEDLQMERGGDIKFTWEPNCEVKGYWKKNENKLKDGGRIRITQSEDPKCCSLTISNTQEEDEGKYTLELFNSAGTASGSANVKVLEYDVNWRDISWGEGNLMKRFLGDLQLSNKKAKHLHFLLCGPVGAGKSSTINSIGYTFQGRACGKAIAGTTLASSQTTIYRTFPIKDHTGKVLPFVLSDTMGMENVEEDGVNTADIVKALKGELKEGYDFISRPPEEIRSNPTVDEKIHCLVNVVSGNRITLLKESDPIIKKLHEIRKAASDLGIPQVVVMTHVDLCCPLVKADLKHVYSSKDIKERMQKCSDLLGVPMNGIFPLKNYSERTDVHDLTDSLILDALRRIVDFANDYLND